MTEIEDYEENSEIEDYEENSYEYDPYADVNIFHLDYDKLTHLIHEFPSIENIPESRRKAKTYTHAYMYACPFDEWKVINIGIKIPFKIHLKLWEELIKHLDICKYTCDSTKRKFTTIDFPKFMSEVEFEVPVNKEERDFLLDRIETLKHTLDFIIENSFLILYATECIEHQKSNI